ncbi:MAG: MFS transporter [Planctomycetes bacterium]|nr:MFS transporter [Planctomycetota bacterium]
MNHQPPATSRWYQEVTGYQWLVLLIASAGWVFDTFEGQIFNITRGQMLTELLNSTPNSPEVKLWGDRFLAIFLVGGTLGGVLFGSLADRLGRKPTMAITILCYSLFSGLTYFATDIWHVGVLRFLVAMGVGGEWAVAAALVAEVFPPRARAQAGGIFHATGILGTWLAFLAGWAVGSDWRYAYLLGLVPALLVVWVRSKVEEPDSWQQAEQQQRQMGSFSELLGVRRWARPAILGMCLAAVGLGTYWGVAVAGQNLAELMLIKQGVAQTEADQQAKFAYGFVQACGAGVGQLCFGPLAVWLGRRRAFALMHLGALLIVPATCYLPQTYDQLLMMLPVFGFFVIGLHAGYAVYFPELFPAHLRATGSSFCFNGGRLLAASMLWMSAELKAHPALDLRAAVSILGLWFLVGLVLLAFLPETRGQELPE